MLGVDPGLTRCGLGVVDGGGGRRVELVAVDVVRTPADVGLDVRLLGISRAVDLWLDEHDPDVVAVERVFSQHNVRTVMGTAQAAGVAVLAAARRGIPVTLHTPSEVKAAVTGSGRAGKEQVAAMVTRILALTEAPRPADATDALALAVCHLWRAPDPLTAAVVNRGTPAGSSRSNVPTGTQQQWARAEREAARPGGGQARLTEALARARSARHR